MTAHISFSMHPRRQESDHQSDVAMPRAESHGSRLPASNVPLSHHPFSFLSGKTPSEMAQLPEHVYARPDNRDRTFEENISKRNIPLDNGCCDQAPTYGIGNLAHLPFELLCDVLLMLDVCILTNFRRVNKRQVQITDTVPLYPQIVTRCPLLLRAALGIDAAKLLLNRGTNPKP